MRTHLTLALLLGLAACGKVQSFTDAGSDDDNGIDADTTDAPATGSLTVHTLVRCCGSTTPDQPDVFVFVSHVDGTAGDTATTDASGHATLDVTGGDTVTAIYPVTNNAYYYITSIVAVQPGDTLTFGDGPQPPPNSPIGSSMTFTWNAAPNITYYYLYTQCGGWYVPAPSTTVSFQRYDDCNPATFDVVVVGYDATTYQISYASHATNVTWQDGGSLLMPNLTATQTVSLSMTGLPQDASYASINATSYIHNTYNGGGGFGGGPSGGTFSGSFPLPTGGDGLQSNSYVSRTNFGSQSINRWQSPPPATISFDYTSHLPWLGDAIVNQTAHQWTLIQDTAGADTPDYLVTQFNWYRPLAALGISGYYYYWTMFSPGIAPTSGVLPEIPAAAGDILNDTDSPYVNELEYIDSSDVNSWDDARALSERQLNCPDCVQQLADQPDEVRYSSGNSGGK